jgi:hypothetical protein
LDRFDRLLPSLVAQDLGGGIGVHTHAGIWLRRLGVDALIFPSARCNVSVEVLDGEVTDHYGWNLVDYRQAPEPQSEIGHDSSDEWAEHPMVGANILLGASGGDPFIYAGTTIDYELEGPRRGSLAVKELEEQRECMALLTTWFHFVDRVRPVMDEDEANRLTSIIFEASIAPGGLMRTKVASGLSNLFISAAIGDAAAVIEIVRLANQSADQGEVVTAKALAKFLAVATAKGKQ